MVAAEKISRQDKAVASESVLLKYLIVLAGAGALYIITCAPTILWQDSGRFVYRIWHNDIQGKIGLALAHPLYILAGMAVKCIPIGQLAYRVNLMSAVFGAVAVANLFLLLRLWLGSSLPAVIAAVTLALSHTFWYYTSIAEVYTLYAALLTGELIMLLRYMQSSKVGYLYWLGLLNGLAIADHMFASIPLLCYVVFFVVLLAKKQIGLKHFGIVVLLWVIGAAPYEYLIIKNIIVSGDVEGTLASAVFGNVWQSHVLNISVSMKMVLENIIFILLNFPTPNFLFLFLGLGVIWKKSPNRRFANIIIAMLILYFIFAFRYTVPDRYAFFVPFYCMASVLIGLGAYIVHRRMSSKIFVCLVLIFAFLPIPVYAAGPIIAEKVGFSLGTKREIPYRNEYRYFLCPWKAGYRGTDRFANEALALVENNAIIYADGTTAYALLYIQQVGEKRQDVKIVSDRDSSKGAPVLDENTVAGLMAKSALYVVSPVKGYCLPFLLERYDFVRVGVLWKVVERKAKDDI